MDKALYVTRRPEYMRQVSVHVLPSLAWYGCVQYEPHAFQKRCFPGAFAADQRIELAVQIHPFISKKGAGDVQPNPAGRSDLRLAEGHPVPERK